MNGANGVDGDRSVVGKTNAERQAQMLYWTEHSVETTVEAMMLDSQAKAIDLEERPEVLAMLGSVKGKRVMELGAGIGRFTGDLGAQAKSVLALDFMKRLIEENERKHGHMGNITFKAGDACELEADPESFDVVFTNWLLMYLGDEEVSKLMHNMLTWLTEDGFLFFRESCFKPSGDKKRGNNPTHYRSPKDYFAVVDSLENKEADGRYSHFELISCKCVDTYVRVKKNQSQICWKWKKVYTKESGKTEFRHFLDNQQYQTSGILRYERIFGQGYVSTGGFETTKDFVNQLDLKPGQRILDVGCGIGGGDFYMAAEHGVFVHGIDLSVNMVLIAIERAGKVPGGASVSFEIADCTLANYPPRSFDVIYSRDTILHIQDKPALFKRFAEWLKPGGKVLISDYCQSAGKPSSSFAKYIEQRGYDLHSVAGYGEMIKDVGFVNVEADDRTWQFEECLKRELALVQKDRSSFIKEFSESDYNAIEAGWKDKLVRVGDGEQRWGLFKAVKPSSG